MPHQSSKGALPHSAAARAENGSGSVLSRALPRAWRTALFLLRIIVPVSFVAAWLKWSGVLALIGKALAPLMSFFHLPGEAAVPLVSGFLAGIYALIGALAVVPCTPAEITILSAMALIAHNLIVECTVQDRAGTPWAWMLVVRLLGSMLIGAVVAWSITGLQAAHLPALWLRVVPSPLPQPAAAGDFGHFLIHWLRDAGRLAAKLILIVTGMMIATEWVRSRGILERLERSCRPILRVLGLRDPVAYPWLTAQFLGVAFGAGLLIEEMRESPRYTPRDVRDLHTSIGISHSLFEDTVLLVAIGASLFWIIVPRFILAGIAVRVLAPFRMGLRPARPGTES